MLTLIVMQSVCQALNTRVMPAIILLFKNKVSIIFNLLTIGLIQSSGPI